MRLMQGKEKRPLPLHPIPSNKRRTKCQGWARSDMSGFLPAVQGDRVIGKIELAADESG
jgi:hypothetical protein